jgi:S1-C subfamily serine protease
VDRRLANYYDLPVQRGVLVARVAADGPATLDGVRGKDIILEVYGSPVGRVEDLSRILRSRRVGDHLVLGLLRGGEALHPSIEVGEAPPGPPET